jgi:hypothetical protein
MRRRVFIVAGEYSANPRDLPPERRSRDFYYGPHPTPAREQMSRLFFRYPNRGDEGRIRPEDWQRAFNLSKPLGLPELFASAAHKALTTLHELQGGDYRRTCESITDMLVTSMPGLDPYERLNIGLVPQGLQVLLGLSPRARSQFVVGTSDSGAQAFAEAVRTARTAERPSTILVLAGQVIPAGYASQYQIRTVLGEDDQARGMDMLAVGDLLMDALRRSFRLSPQEVESFLARVSSRKGAVGVNYPAGIHAGLPHKRDTRRTPWFDASDIAVPCCGAAATIVTSDEELVEAIAASRNPRFRTAPLTEVLAVGDGSTNPDLLHRKAPLLFAPAIYSAFAATADDARMPVSTFTSCAFGVVHDAFPSIELSFLLALGLGWERAAERMAEGWSNPVGGLLTFGHALGASGLVQVNKAHHVFCVDQRHLLEADARQGFREDGALAFTTSVGGPLSHIVCSLLRGGRQEHRPARQRRDESQAQSPVSADWDLKARMLSLLLPAQLRAADGAWLVEATTTVSIRSCLLALSQEDVAQLQFEGLEKLIAPAGLEELRRRLRAVVRVVRQESERVGSMFDAFRLLTDEILDIVKENRDAGRLRAEVAGLPDEKIASRMKECLTAPLALLTRPDGNSSHRSVRYLPDALPLRDVGFVEDAHLRPVSISRDALPFWDLNATRPAGSGVAAGGAGFAGDGRSAKARSIGDATVRLHEIATQGPKTDAELELLRTWFSLDSPPPLLERALRNAGVERPQATQVRAVFYLGEIADPGKQLPLPAAHAMLGFAAQRARAFLEAYESAISQLGPELSAVAFARPPYRAGMDAALYGAARFAQEIARAALEQGIRVRAAVSAGEGAVYDDANGTPSVTSPSAARVAELLAALRPLAGNRPAFALEGASFAVLTALSQRMAGWTKVDGPPGVSVWLGPDA